jgi:hypothetical protein
MVSSAPPITLEEKRQALDAVLNGTTFARSVQLRAFLRYICEREMAGHTEELNEYQIAVEVLGRPKDINLSDDSSVRNRAYELRQRLEKYYATEDGNAPIRIAIPRGGYIPYYTRHLAAATVEPAATNQAAAGPVEVLRRSTRWKPHWAAVAGIALALLGIGWWGGATIGRPHPASIVAEAWGPLAEGGDPLLICIATNLHMIVRPHIGEYPLRFPAPKELYSLYGPNRPLRANEPLYMEPAPLSVPLGELAAASTLSITRAALGGSYQILPESEAPVTALRGRNVALIGSGTNSNAAVMLLHNLPFTIDYSANNRFALIDQRKPAGQRELIVTQATGDPVPGVSYGLLSIITTTGPTGTPKRTLVISGAISAGVQAAVEFFCSPAHLAELKKRFQAAGIHGFPATYQVLVRCKTFGVRLVSYEYAAHEVVQKAL